MKQYTVQITDKALVDMEEIYIYIAEQLLAPENAMGQYNRIAEAIQNLNVFPERVRIMESEPEHTMGLRQLPIDNFSVFYVIEDHRVVVTRVLYSASDISRRLLER
ncbi:MAG: type II toxin-antitoxin system RelE/ParE family toxin [Lachnospiraceae bacterium]|nr:type II toxin-antitoxin system RelE/ParE family toxin [Lachnospiraceae bacterium]